jgi:precorrin-3B C17-methyltransferase
MVPEALNALRSAEIIVGYKTYLDLIADLTEGKKTLASGMRKEVDRCQASIDHALAGYRVALVSSGDAGIYGMAGLVFDICRERGLSVRPPVAGAEDEEGGQGVEDKKDKRGKEGKGGRGGRGGEEGTEDEAAKHGEVHAGPPDFLVEVIPGVAAFNAAASLVGAPLMHDFAAVSLSDHLTPWELIEKRLAAASSADFVLAIYNPRSKTRPNLLDRAREVLLRYRSPQTPVAIVRRAMREGEWKHVTTLEALPVHEVDMQSVLIVGNSNTYVWDGWMITPRGYLDKYTLSEAESSDPA